MCWLQVRSKTNSTPTLLSGTGLTSSCDGGSPSMPLVFLARLHARPTRGQRLRTVRKPRQAPGRQQVGIPEGGVPDQRALAPGEAWGRRRDVETARNLSEEPSGPVSPPGRAWPAAGSE